MDKLSRFKKLFETCKAIIFDFDGVLVDSEKFHFMSYRDVFARHGHTVDEVEYYKYWTSLGHGSRGEVERHNLDLDPIMIRDEKRPIFSKYCRDGSIELFPEAQEIVRILAEADKILTIGSGTVRPDIEAILENAGLRDTFRTIVGSDMVERIKPHPDTFLRILDDIELEPYECLVIEDAEKGLQAAQTAHIPVVVIRTRETKDFDFSPADLTLDSHGEFLELLRAMYPR